jgi:phosphatidylserine/phosphatidylglycerophosphate/cardiolipin synthase-like enzyme
VPAFFSPVAEPLTWSYTIVDGLDIPEGLRYGVKSPAPPYRVRAVRATRDVAADVLMPATGVLRRAAGATGQTFVEIQVIPFPIRRVANAIPGGLPTFYLVFDEDAGLTFAEGDGGLGGTTLRTAIAVTILAVRQDRMLVDPALWAAQIATAITTAGGDASEWQPFASALAAATATGDDAPVLLYDHAGRPRTSGRVKIVLEDQERFAALAPEDGGDLQRTVARLHASDPTNMPIANLWGGGRTEFRLEPEGAAGAVQLVRIEDGAVADTGLTLTPTLRSVAFTNLEDWFAAQSTEELPRFTRGDLITPLVNGPAFYDDFFAAMRDAQRPGGGVHLTGWAIFSRTKFTHRQLGDDPLATFDLDVVTPLLGPDNIALTLEQAATLIGDAGGASRFLAAKFLQFDDPSTVSQAEILVVMFFLDLILLLSRFGVSFARTDGLGTFILMLGAIGLSLYTKHVLDEDGKPLEPNKQAVDVLDGVTGARCVFSPARVRVEDNVPPPPLNDFPFNALLTVTRHLGIYHQKLSIVKGEAGHIAYCGGMDLNPDRLDDVDHLAAAPYHDVHVRVEGNAARDLAVTFDQRWQLDGGGSPPAFPVPPFDPALAPGRDIAQIARTYHAPAIGAESRALPFAPDGDSTFARTTLAAIELASEYIYTTDQYFTPPRTYRDLLLRKVANREIRQLIIALHGQTTLTFGDASRAEFIDELMTADGGAGIVRIGYPRRRFTSTDNEVRASSGKLLVGQDMLGGANAEPTIFLGPPSRIPALPFWVSVEGELMYVYDESGAINSHPELMKALVCERGDSTRLVSGGPSPTGAFPRQHKQGAPATVVELADIYVHDKLTIIDDVFLAVGSANLDHRGFYYDGEIHCFTIADGLRLSPRNPAAMLRQQLWAEFLDLPAEMVAPLLADPLASGKLFDRSPFAGNRFTPVDARPPHLFLHFSSSDGAIADLFQALGFAIQAPHTAQIFKFLVDPSSRTDPRPET